MLKDGKWNSPAAGAELLELLFNPPLREPTKLENFIDWFWDALTFLILIHLPIVYFIGAVSIIRWIIKCM